MGALSASTSSVNWIVEDDILLKNAVEVTPAARPPIPPTAILGVPTVRLDASIEAPNVVPGLLALERDGFRGVCVYRDTG